MVRGDRPGRLAVTNGRGLTTEYAVSELTDRTGRVVGYRLAKDDGECWDVDADLWECSCPDYLWRAAARAREGLPPACKHSAALKAALPRCAVLV